MNTADRRKLRGAQALGLTQDVTVALSTEEIAVVHPGGVITVDGLPVQSDEQAAETGVEPLSSATTPSQRNWPRRDIRRLWETIEAQSTLIREQQDGYEAQIATLTSQLTAVRESMNSPDPHMAAQLARSKALEAENEELKQTLAEHNRRATEVLERELKKHQHEIRVLKKQVTSHTARLTPTPHGNPNHPLRRLRMILAAALLFAPLAAVTLVSPTDSALQPTAPLHSAAFSLIAG